MTDTALTAEKDSADRKHGDAVARLTDRRARPKTGMGQFVTDRELAEYLGIPWETAKPIIDELDRRTDFPKKEKPWGRRYLKAVSEWLDRSYGLKSPPQRRTANDR